MGGQLVQGGILGAAACNVELVPVLPGDGFHLTVGFAVAVRQRMIDAVDEVSVRGRRCTGLSKGSSDFRAHILRSRETRIVHIKNAGVGAGLCQLHHFRKGDAQLLLHALDDPQAHDVFQIADVAHAAFICEICFAAFWSGDRLCQFDTQQAPGAGRKERCLPLLHRDALHRAGSVVGGTQHHVGLPAHLGGDLRLQRTQHRAGCGQRREHGFRQAQRREDLRVVFSDLGVDKAGGGGVGVLTGLDAAEFPE